jgi:hypothetical protein
MVPSRLILPLVVLGFIIGGCGSGSKNQLKKGDIVIVQEELRERAETQWADSYTDGFTTEIPKGTRLEVLFTPAPASPIFECRPVEVNGKKDAAEVEAFFVPDHIRTKDGYVSYAFALKKEYLGTKVKKAE